MPATETDVGALWKEAYEGEVLGEALFDRLAEMSEDPARAEKHRVLCRMERRTKEEMEPVVEQLGLDVDRAKAVREGSELAEGAAVLPWGELMASIEPNTQRFLEMYRHLEQLASHSEQRRVAGILVAHEQALEEFARRELAGAPERSLEPVRALAHLA